MKVSTEKQEGQVVLNIEVEPEEMEKAKDKAYRRLVARYTIPGFRRGKAPRAMLERFVGSSVLVNEAINQLVPELFDQALQENEIEAIAEPQMEITSYDPVTVKATVPVRPVVGLGDYLSVRVAQESAAVADQEVEHALEQIRLQRARWEQVERPVEMGDNVILSIHGTANGRTVMEQKETSYLVRPGSDQPAPGFAEALVGTALDEEKEIRLSFPADHAVERLAGKAFVFKVKVHRVEGRQLPELNDEFARGLGLPDVAEVEQLRKYLQAALQREADAAARARLEDQVVARVIEGASVEFPPVLVEQQVDFMVQNRTEALRQQGIGLDQWLKYLGKTEQEVREELRPQARDLVKRELVLQEVIQQQSIQAEEGEITSQVERASAESAEAPDREAVARNIRRLKAVRRLVEIAAEGAVSYPPLDEPVAAAAAPAAEAAAPLPEAEQSSAGPAEAVAASGEEQLTENASGGEDAARLPSE